MVNSADLATLSGGLPLVSHQLRIQKCALFFFRQDRAVRQLCWGS